MSDVVSKFLSDHEFTRKLLASIERQRDRHLAGQFLDETIVEGIIVYLEYYPALFHHPKEDLVYRKLKERNELAVGAMGDLEAAHAVQKHLLGRFRTITHQVLYNAQIPENLFVETVNGFVDEYRRHMEMEESVFFPAAIESLDSEDWFEIDAQITYPADPVFGEQTEEHFKALRQDIISWDWEVQDSSATAFSGGESSA